MDYETERVVQRLGSHLKCMVDKRHKGVDFICVHPRCMSDRVVCVDCLKHNPSHFSAHGPSLIRVDEFLSDISKCSVSENELKQLSLMAENIKFQIEKEKNLKKSIKKQIEVYFESVQTEIIEVTRKTLAQYCNQSITKTESAATVHISELESSLQDANELLKFRNKGQLLDLFITAEKATSQADIRVKINKLVTISNNLESSIADWINQHKGFIKKSQNDQTTIFNPSSEWKKHVARQVGDAIQRVADESDLESWIIHTAKNVPASFLASAKKSRMSTPDKDLERSLAETTKYRQSRLADIDKRIESLLWYMRII